MHQASLEFEVRTNTDDLESHLSLGFPLGGLPDRVATPAARLDTRNWLWAAAEVQKATTCFWLARADRSDYEETIIATSRRKEARLRRWVEALRTGELPDPLSVPRPTAHDPSDWQAAEALAAVALQHMGWKDAALTQAGADSGIDVLGRHVAAQVKHQTMPVGRPVLQRLVGAGRGKELACFSKSGFSRQAMNFADEEGIALFEIELPASVAATNDAAREWLKSWEN